MKNVFYFTADWCQPCKKVKPIIEEMKREGFQFQMIDADYEQLLVKQFKVSSIPTFILLEDGKELSRISGAKTRGELEDFINYEKTTQENI
jgi:thioredoxin-like negative regulator of GroEL